MTDGLASRFTVETDSPGLMLWRVTNRWQAAIRRSLAPFDLTHVQFVLLATLTWTRDGGGITQVELARRVRSDPMMVSQVLRTLVDKGLVERHRDPDDGRAYQVAVTPIGAALARAVNRAVEAADVKFFGTDSQLPRPLVEHLAELDRRHPHDPVTGGGPQTNG